MVLSLVGVMVITRTVGAEEYGSFIILRVVVLFLAQISGMGLASSIPVFVNATDDDGKKSQIINSALLFRLATIIVLGLLSLPFADSIARLFDSTMSLGHAAFIPILFFFEAIFGLLQASLQSFHRFQRMGIADAISSTTNLLFIFIFVVWLKMGFIGLLQARSIALGLAIVFQYINLPIARKPQLNTGVLREMLKFGLPLQLNDILSFVFSRIDTVLLGLLLGSAGVAYYEIARKIPDTLTLAYEAYRAVYFPFVSKFSAEGKSDKLARILNHSLRLGAFLPILGALLALLFGREVFLLVFTEEYLPSVTPFIILMGGLSLYAVGYTLGTTQVAIGETDKPVLANIAHTITSVATSLVLIPILGATGAAIASIAGSIVSNPLDVFFLRRKDVEVDVMTYVKPMFLFVVHAVVYMVTMPENLLVSSLFVVTFLAGSVLFSVVTMDDINLLFSEGEKLLRSLKFPSLRKSEL